MIIVRVYVAARHVSKRMCYVMLCYTTSSWHFINVVYRVPATGSPIPKDRVPAGVMIGRMWHTIGLQATGSDSRVRIRVSVRARDMGRVRVRVA